MKRKFKCVLMFIWGGYPSRDALVEPEDSQDRREGEIDGRQSGCGRTAVPERCNLQLTWCKRFEDEDGLSSASAKDGKCLTLIDCFDARPMCGSCGPTG